VTRLATSNTPPPHSAGLSQVDDIGFKTKIPSADGGFNGTLPISVANEAATLIALRDTVHSLGTWYPTSVEEDDALLALTSLGPKVRRTQSIRIPHACTGCNEDEIHLCTDRCTFYSYYEEQPNLGEF
jgi:hypothetical protein